MNMNHYLCMQGQDALMAACSGKIKRYRLQQLKGLYVHPKFHVSYVRRASGVLPSGRIELASCHLHGVTVELNELTETHVPACNENMYTGLGGGMVSTAVFTMHAGITPC